MRQPRSESDIVKEVADDAARRIADQVRRFFQGQKAQLSGDDTELETVWDEICVQVQFEESVD